MKKMRFVAGRYRNCFLIFPAVWVMQDMDYYYVALGWLNFGCNLVIGGHR